MNRQKNPAFVTLGEVMIRDTPADNQRLERTRMVMLSPAGTEFSVAVGVSRFGVPSRFVTRVPDNSYGRMLEAIGRENGVDMDYLVWAPATEPIGRFLYERGRTPRPTAACYQRMHSAASKLGPGMVDWKSALEGAKILHVSGITFGLASHSGYDTNYLLECFKEAASARPDGCLVGLDFNYRGTLWSIEQVRRTLLPVLENDVDILITTAEDMAQFFDIPCGKLSPQQVLTQGEPFSDEDLKALTKSVCERFKLKLVAFTKRYPDSLEDQRWESVAGNGKELYFRSPSQKSFRVLDRLGGGDAWDSGFYTAILESGISQESIALGVKQGDAAIAIQQTLMFDLPMVTRAEIDAAVSSTGAGRDVRR